MGSTPTSDHIGGLSQYDFGCQMGGKTLTLTWVPSGSAATTTCVLVMHHTTINISIFIVNFCFIKYARNSDSELLNCHVKLGQNYIRDNRLEKCEPQIRPVFDGKISATNSFMGLKNQTLSLS